MTQTNDIGQILSSIAEIEISTKYHFINQLLWLKLDGKANFFTGIKVA